ncbi:MAG: hypothetical protein J7501_08465 [Bdellovibrio sp.]|nr:hypothetical protein [Bdellovibrio sp.]
MLKKTPPLILPCSLLGENYPRLEYLHDLHAGQVPQGFKERIYRSILLGALSRTDSSRHRP